jgi:hypothetical protein
MVKAICMHITNDRVVYMVCLNIFSNKNFKRF